MARSGFAAEYTDAGVLHSRKVAEATLAHASWQTLDPLPITDPQCEPKCRQQPFRAGSVRVRMVSPYW